MQSALVHAIDQLPPAMRSELLTWYPQHSLAVLPAELMQRLQQVSGLTLPQLTQALAPALDAFVRLLTEAVARGKHVWERNSCINCHTILGEGAYLLPSDCIPLLP